MSFRPIEASKKIAEEYQRYLQTIFAIDDPEYQKQLAEQLQNPETLSAGPYLDVVDSFLAGKSLNDLIKSGKITQSFSSINTNLERPLYKHQEQAILKIISGKNVVVSTGTGSGKTESFLFPIINYLLQQSDKNELNPGVRALLISTNGWKRLKRWRNVRRSRIIPCIPSLYWKIPMPECQGQKRNLL